MPSNVIRASRKELETRRANLLKQAGISLDELRRRRDQYALTGEQWEITSELEDIEFLLAG